MQVYKINPKQIHQKIGISHMPSHKLAWLIKLTSYKLSAPIGVI